MRLSTLIALVLLLWQAAAFSFWYEKPKEFMAPSSNGRYLFHVVPRIPVAYRHGVEHAEGSDGIPSIYGCTEVCYGTLFSVQNGHCTPVWRGRLANPVSPNEAIPADDGSAVVTIGNWAKEGDEEFLIVVYGKDGALLGTFKLEDLYTAEELATLRSPETGRLRWEGKRYFDVKKHLFIMELLNGHLFRIDLRTGKIVPATE